MTDKAKELRSLRSDAMRQLGFGPEIMKQTKVCPGCGATAGAEEAECICCGGALPKETLFDLYKRQHQYCTACGTVVSGASAYCPECGVQLKRQQPRFAQRKAV